MSDCYHYEFAFPNFITDGLYFFLFFLFFGNDLFSLSYSFYSRFFSSGLDGVVYGWDRRISPLPYLELTNNSQTQLTSLQLDIEDRVSHANLNFFHWDHNINLKWSTTWAWLHMSFDIILHQIFISKSCFSYYLLGQNIIVLDYRVISYICWVLKNYTNCVWYYGGYSWRATNEKIPLGNCIAL